MSRFRYRDDDSSNRNAILGALAGAVAGFAVGMFVADRFGGFSGLRSRLRRQKEIALRHQFGHGVADEIDDEVDAEVDDGFEDIEEDEIESDEYGESLEERVLEAFRNDPLLSERAIDIGEIREGVVELAGWVETPAEAQHAVTIARGVPGIDTVVNRILASEEERALRRTARRAREGDPSLTESGWEGQQVGTGRRRQGTSDEPDRHADPKVDLEDRWLNKDAAVRNAADDIGPSTAHPPRRVPKADHVADVGPEAD
jgi:hypothetical protein